MKYKEEIIFRNLLGALLDKAKIGNDEVREIFIAISWKKYSSKNKYDNLLNHSKEYELTLPIRNRLKEQKLWYDYVRFMKDGKQFMAE